MAEVIKISCDNCRKDLTTTSADGCRVLLRCEKIATPLVRSDMHFCNVECLESALYKLRQFMAEEAGESVGGITLRKSKYSAAEYDAAHA